MRIAPSAVSLLGLLSSIALAQDAAKPSAVDILTEPDEPRIPGRSSGCDVKDFKFAATPGGESKRLKMGKERYFRITLPANYKHGTPAPLLLALHDQNMTSKDMEETTLLSSPTYNKDAIIVYPEAKEDSRWQSDGNPSNANDIGFVDALLDRLNSRLCVDDERIYATGLGTGGGMMHILACSNLSSRIAAFSIVSGNIFQGLQGDGATQVKDPTTLMWNRCQPERPLVRLQSIHTENNTIFDYWGQVKNANRERVPTVRQLVEWATRNGCGKAKGYPSQWRGDNDTIHKTLLEQGYIFEGFIEDGAVVKATYHCWPDEVTEQLLKEAEHAPPETNAEGAKGDVGQEGEAKTNTDNETSKPPPEKTQSEEEKFADELKLLDQTFIHEHYFVRNQPHGWHRVEKVPSEPDSKRKAEGKTPTLTQPPPEWKPLGDLPQQEVLVDMSKNTSSFSYGFLEPLIPDRPARFDTTERVLSFLRMYKLSDPLPEAPRNVKGLTDVEQEMIDSIMGQIQDAVDKGTEGHEPFSNGGEIPILHMDLPEGAHELQYTVENMIAENPVEGGEKMGRIKDEL